MVFLFLRYPLSKSAPQKLLTTSRSDALGPVDGDADSICRIRTVCHRLQPVAFPLEIQKYWSAWLRGVKEPSKRTADISSYLHITSYLPQDLLRVWIEIHDRIRPLTHLHFFFLFFSRICNSYSIFRGFWSESILRRLITWVLLILSFVFSCFHWSGLELGYFDEYFEENLGFCWSKLWSVGGNRVCLGQGSILVRDYELWWFSFFFFFRGVVGFGALKAEEDELNGWGMRNGVKSRGHRKIVFPSEFLCVLEMSRQATHLVKSDGFNFFSISFGFMG